MATRRKTPLVNSSSEVLPADEATRYALAVVSGETIAGPDVRAACKRHLDDLQAGHERGLVWSLPHVERVLRFFRRILYLNGGDFEGVPFDPLPWQAFILGSLFGWQKLDKPCFTTTVPPANSLRDALQAQRLYRRFRVAYQETGKGSGKSPLAAGVGLYMMVADNEPRAEVYAAATKKDQAMILFRDAVAMVDQSAPLRAKIKQSGKQPNVWNLSYLTTGSFFRPIAADEGQSGPRPHCALLDEVHEHKTGHVIEMLRAGFKFRKQPLQFMITNSGSDKTSVCWEYHEYGSKVAAGQLQDDTFFSYVASNDEGEDPFLSEECWPKSNPSLGHTIQVQYLRDQVLQARSMPSKESTVRRLNFCQWTQADTPWITSALWEKNSAAPVPLEQLRGAPCVAGLDLSKKNDLSALVLLFPHDDDTVSVHPFFWAPAEGIVDKERSDRVPYSTWERHGHITLTPGPVIEYSFIAHQIAELLNDYDLRLIHFDRWRIEDLKRELKNLDPDLEWEEDEGPLQPHGQGYKDMGPSLEAAEDLLAEGKLRHGNHPVLTWCVSNVVVTKDSAELRKFDKSRATGRIDGAVGLVMAARAMSGGILDDPLSDFLSDPLIL